MDGKTIVTDWWIRTYPGIGALFEIEREVQFHPLVDAIDAALAQVVSPCAVCAERERVRAKWGVEPCEQCAAKNEEIASLRAEVATQNRMLTHAGILAAQEEHNRLREELKACQAALAHQPNS